MASTFISSPSRNDLLSYAALFVFAGIYAAFLIPFVAHAGLVSFFSDSAHYLLMARYLSPWHEASPAVVAAWPRQDFPPFFPFILAILGAAYDYTLAHVLTALFLLLSIPLIFIFARSMFAANHQALLIVFIFCLSPSAWLNSMGILSEPLYLFLSLATLIFFDKSDLSRKANLFIFGLLLALLVLTRTIGVAMLAAFIVICIVKWRRGSLDGPYFVIPVFFSLAVIAASWWAHNTVVPSVYIDQIGGLLGSETEKIRVSWDLKEQLAAFHDNWLGGLLYYWTDQTLPAQSIILLAGLFSLLGLCIRVGQGKLNAIYVLLYLLVLFLWPYPEYIGRFIYPILCLLIMYSFYFLYVCTRRMELKRGGVAVSIAMVLVLTTVLPTLSYTWHRYQTGKESGYHQIKEFYDTYDLKQARQLAATKLAMSLEMERMRKTTAPDAVILSSHLIYIPLLADRIARDKITFNRDPAGELYMEHDPEVDYIYLFRSHPGRVHEDSDIIDVNGLYLRKYIPDQARLLWEHRSAENNELLSAFFKISD